MFTLILSQFPKAIGKTDAWLSWITLLSFFWTMCLSYVRFFIKGIILLVTFFSKHWKDSPISKTKKKSRRTFNWVSVSPVETSHISAVIVWSWSVTIIIGFMFTNIRLCSVLKEISQSFNKPSANWSWLSPGDSAYIRKSRKVCFKEYTKYQYSQGLSVQYGQLVRYY